MSTTPRALGYIRVSTIDQADSGLSLEAQTQAIHAAATARGWALVDVIADAGVSGTKRNRPGLDRAKQHMADGDADLLIVAKFDRLFRSVKHGSDLMVEAEKQGWALVDLGSGVDMTTPQGILVTHMLMAAAQYESQIGGVRTKEAMANLPDDVRDRMRNGGRPRTLDLATDARIRELHADGRSLRGIAAALTAEGVPTPSGGKWWPTTIRKILNRDPQETTR